MVCACMVAFDVGFGLRRYYWFSGCGILCVFWMVWLRLKVLYCLQGLLDCGYGRCGCFRGVTLDKVALSFWGWVLWALS